MYALLVSSYILIDSNKRILAYEDCNIVRTKYGARVEVCKEYFKRKPGFVIEMKWLNGSASIFGDCDGFGGYTLLDRDGLSATAAKRWLRIHCGAD